MAPLPSPQTMKERILETADKLFYLQGIRAIGVDTIAAEIGISKRTLYNHFPSKDALIAAYLERRFVAQRTSDKPPAEQILATFDSLERRFAAKDFRGCPFVNAVAELGPADRSVKKIAIAFKERPPHLVSRPPERARRRGGRGAGNAARAAGRRLHRPGPRPR
ncbi:AcrR family transcriptional regulator [Bradyrhizobium sp. LM2.7]